MRDKIISSYSKKLIAVLTAIAISLTGIPMIGFSLSENAYAGDGSEGPATVAEAEQALATASQAKETAESEAASAQSAYDSALTAYNDAVADVTNKGEAKDTAQTNVNNEISRIQGEANSNYNSKKDAKETAETEYNTAQGNVNDINNSLTNARNEKSQVEGNIQTLQTSYEELQGMAQTAASALQTAQSNLTQKMQQWNNAKADAETALADAQEAYDKAGRQFINSKVDSIGSNQNNIEQIISKCKTYTSANITAVQNSEGQTLSTVADVANDSNFDRIVDMACSYENLRKNAELINEGNMLRGLAKHKADPLKVNYQLMATAIISNVISTYSTGHNLTKGDTDWTFWDTPNVQYKGENLAYSPVTQWDPFHGWYYKERMRSVANAKGLTNVTQAIVDEILQESIDNGNPYNPYGPPWNQSKEYFLSSISNVTGHYDSLIDNKYKSTGVSYVDSTGIGLSYYKVVAAQEFSSDNVNAVTVDQYLTDLDAFFADVSTALQNAQSAKEALDEKPNYVIEAETSVTNAQNNKNSADAAVTAKGNELSAAQTNLAGIEEQITELEGQLQTANTVLTTKQSAYNLALAEYNNADLAKKAADAIDIEVESTYSQYEELAGYIGTYNNAKSAYDNAVTDCNNKETAKNSAKTTLDSKNSALNTATETYNAAKAAYDEFFKLENAVITAVADQEFTGEEIKPVLTVKNKGETVTLAEDTDYEVIYENNINAGTATATIKGVEGGQYNGSKSISFKINPKDIADNSVTVTVAGGSTYNGSEQEPDVTVKDGDNSLTSNDFELAYSNNITVGENAKVTITGKGNYTGSRTQTFSIAPASLTGATIVLKPIGNESIEMGDTTVYVQETDNAEIKPEIDSVTVGDVELTADDYDVAYSNNTAPGKEAKVTINGKGNYNGKAEVTFTIVSKVEFEIEENINQLNEELDALTQDAETAKDNYKDAEEKAKASKAAADNAAATPGQAAVNAAQKAADDAAVAEEAAKAVEIALADLQEKINEIQQAITDAKGKVVVLKDKIEQYAGEIQGLSEKTAGERATAEQNTKKAEQAKTNASSALEKAKSDKAEADKKAAEGTTPGQNGNTNQDDPKTGNPDKAAGEKADADDDDDDKDAATIAKINAAKAAKVKIKGKALKKLKVQLTWKKVKNVSGFEVYQSAKKKGKFKKLATIKKGTAAKWKSKKIKKGKKGKKVFFKVRAFTIVDGDKVYGKWSNVKAIKLKK